jgi:hypothetical protein
LDLLSNFWGAVQETLPYFKHFSWKNNPAMSPPF